MHPALLRKPCLTLYFVLAYALSVPNIAESLVNMKPRSLQLEIARCGQGCPPANDVFCIDPPQHALNGTQ